MILWPSHSLSTVIAVDLEIPSAGHGMSFPLFTLVLRAFMLERRYNVLRKVCECARFSTNLPAPAALDFRTVGLPIVVLALSFSSEIRKAFSPSINFNY